MQINPKSITTFDFKFNPTQLRKKLLLSFAFWAMLCTAKGQYMRPSGQLAYEQGLIQNTALAVCRQKNGTLWVGTLEGLHRYNGSKFIKVELPPEVKDYMIVHLLVDSNDNIWAFSRKELFIISAKTGKWHIFTSRYSIPNLTQYKDGFITRDLKNNSILIQFKNEEIKLDTIAKGRLYAGYVEDKHITYEPNSTSELIAADTIAALSLGNENIYFLNSGKMLYQQAGSNFSSLSLPFMGVDNLQVLPWVDHSLAVLADFKLYIFKKSKHGVWFLYDAPLPNLRVEAISVDYFNNLIAGTKTAGVVWFAPNSLHFTQIHVSNLKTEWIVWSILFTDDTHMLLSSNIGVHLFELRNNNWAEVELVFNIETTAMVMCNNQIYFGTNRGVYVFNAEKKSAQPLEVSMSKSSIFSLSCLGDEILVGRRDKNYIIHPKTRNILNVPITPVICQTTPFKSGLLLSTYDGIYLLDTATKSAKLVYNTTSKKMGANMFSSTIVAADGSIKASSFSNGLSSLTFINDSLQLANSLNELPSNMIYRIYEDNEGKIWASSNSGLLVIEQNDLRHHYYQSNGQPISEFNQNAMAVAPNGDVLFGGLNGALQFNPKNITHTCEPPLIWVESVDVNYVSAFSNISAAQLPKSFKLDKSARTFTTSISLHNLNEKAYSFYYKLKNFDQEKRKYQKGEIIQYTNLPYNSFELEFWAENENEKFVLFKMPIRRVPPLWMQLWFQLMLAVGLALIISGSVWRYRVRQLKRKLQLAEVENKIQSERLRISRELHDNIGSQLTYVISTLDNLNYQKDEVQKSKKLTDLGSFTRNVMGQLRETIWAMGETNTSVGNLKNRLLAIVSRQQEISKAKIIVDIDAPSDFILEPTQALNLLRCIQEALNNAIKYAHAKNIKIEAKIEKGQLTFMIHDDGRGFEPISAHNGNGMQNMKTRMAEINGTFQIESKPGAGTKITLLINP